MSNSIKIDPSWQPILTEEFEKTYFQDIRNFLTEEIKNRRIFYPHPKNIFHAFDLCPWNQLKVVILGQDPYHDVGQAHGLCFSVPQGVKIPPSLKNIYKELHQVLKLPIPDHGNLENWAQQGVLLLNVTLTVRAHEANSHSKIGWQQFTNSVIQKISAEKSGIIFLLWGNFARAKKTLIDTNKHTVLEAAHPSPFSAHSGFFGCGHFGTTNETLRAQGKSEINWTV